MSCLHISKHDSICDSILDVKWCSAWKGNCMTWKNGIDVKCTKNESMCHVSPYMRCPCFFATYNSMACPIQGLTSGLKSPHGHKESCPPCLRWGEKDGQDPGYGHHHPKMGQHCTSVLGATTERLTTERLMTEQLTTERLTTERLRKMWLND